VILFEMLTGKVPFGGVGYGEILVKHITVRPPAARSIVADLPPTMDLILARALAKEPQQRFATMAEFREALLNPELYASSAPTAGVHEDFTGRVRDAKPMARSEMSLGPPRADHLAGAAPGASTFRDSIGEVWVRRDQDEPRPSHGARNALLVGLVLAGGVVGAMKYGHEARRFVAAAAAPSLPATVRVNFNSDPQGASVVRSDGVVLGTTPLSTEVPYGNEATAYVLRLDGYLPKTTAIVPNLPTPLFAVLQAVEHDPSPDPTLAADTPPAGAATSGTPAPTTEKRTMARQARRRPRPEGATPAPRFDVDVDDVMGPSVR